MPNKKSAEKALRQAKKRTIRNLKVKRDLKQLLKVTLTHLEKKEQEATNKVKEAYQALDKAAKKGILKKNTASRKKSRLMKKLNLMLKK